MKENLIQKKTFEFALKIIRLYKKLKENWEFILSKQVLRSWTSIWANIEEAIAWQTKKDFLTKCSIASKEAREMKYWLRLLQESNIYSCDYDNYIKEIDSIINILTKIVKTTTNSISYKD